MAICKKCVKHIINNYVECKFCNNFYHTRCVYGNVNDAQWTIRSQGALLWNSIPDNIKNSPSSYVFKKKYKDYLINLYN